KFVNATDYRTIAEKETFTAENFRNPGFKADGDMPAVFIAWNDAMAFCDWLSKTEGANYRLPTEAEWEYACRAGTITQFYWGDDPGDAARYAWFAHNSDGTPHYVGSKLSNPFGLFDMHGNAIEWCRDYFQPYDNPLPTPLTDPKGPLAGDRRIQRGG